MSWRGGDQSCQLGPLIIINNKCFNILLPNFKKPNKYAKYLSLHFAKILGQVYSTIKKCTTQISESGSLVRVSGSLDVKLTSLAPDAVCIATDEIIELSCTFVFLVPMCQSAVRNSRLMSTVRTSFSCHRSKILISTCVHDNFTHVPINQKTLLKILRILNRIRLQYTYTAALKIILEILSRKRVLYNV